jgi:hypothetical protein
VTHEKTEYRLVREVLEGAMAPKVAQAVLFEALGNAPALPENISDMLVLVRGPVKDALRRRAGAMEATALVARLEHMLGRRQSQPPPPADHDATLAVPTDADAVRVLIVAAGPWFGGRLAAALGPGRVAPVYAHSAEALAHTVGTWPPSLLVVDATDFPAIEPKGLAQALRKLPSTTTVAIWGGDLPYGRRALFALEEAGVHAMGFEQGAGIEPLMDVIRSRRNQ